MVQMMKELAAEKIPCGEELASVASQPSVFSLEEYCSTMLDTPEIKLEKEAQWPVDQDLIY
jgi:hypothetical protein